MLHHNMDGCQLPRLVSSLSSLCTPLPSLNLSCHTLVNASLVSLHSSSCPSVPNLSPLPLPSHLCQSLLSFLLLQQVFAHAQTRLLLRLELFLPGLREKGKAETHQFVAREEGNEGGREERRTLSPCSSLIFPGAKASSRSRRLACSFSALPTSLCRTAASAFSAWMVLSRDWRIKRVLARRRSGETRGFEMNAGGTHLLLLQGLGEFRADDGELGLVLIELPLDVVEPVQVR